MHGNDSPHAPRSHWLRAGWIAAIAALVAQRAWNALHGPLMRGYDDFAHIGYVLFLDLYGAVPYADQGWAYFHPPLHYAIGWALAQFDSAIVLLRGLAFVASAASLGVAALAAWGVRMASPERPVLALVAFVSVGFLPVHVYTSTMAGNELLASFFGALGLALFIANERRAHPTPARSAAAGLAIGLGLLTKVSALLVLASAGVSLLGRAALGRERGEWKRAVARGLSLAGVALAISAPFFARNLAEYGTLTRLGTQYPLTAELEGMQPPGTRSWGDFVSVPVGLFADPRLEEEPLVRSVWGSAYAQTWADLRSDWQELFHAAPRLRTLRRVTLTLGLAPTLLALLGAALALRDALRGRRAAVYAPLLAMSVLSLCAFVLFALRVPTFSAVKASYLMGLTLPYAAFLARALESLAGAARGAGPLGISLVLTAASASALVNTSGVLLPRLPDQMFVGSLHHYFGELDRARRHNEQRLRRKYSPFGRSWTENLAAIELLEGRPLLARALYARRSLEPWTPFQWNALGVTTALSGMRERALPLFDRAIAAGAGEVAYQNRGAVHAALGDLVEAEADLRRALALDAQLAPAWHALAEVLAATGRADESRAAAARAEAAAHEPPRGYPYGIPYCLAQAPRRPRVAERWMLWLEGSGLLLARAPFQAFDAIAPGDPHAAPPSSPHVALIVIDTLRADHLGAYGYDRPTSPRIDALAGEGTLFSRAFAPSSWTLPSVASLLTSQHSTVHGATAWGDAIGPRLPTLAERMREAGHATLAVSGNFLHVTAASGLARGFDTWETLSFPVRGAAVDRLFALGDPEDHTGLRAATGREINATVLKHLPRADEGPLFLYVHYMEPHSGYDPPEPERSTFVRDRATDAAAPAATSDYVTAIARGDVDVDASERRRLLDLYDGEIATVDRALGELLDALAERGFAENLVVAVVSDHGEAFGEHSDWFHGTNLHAELLRVPLVIHDARRPGRGAVRDDLVDLLDVPTTLLALAGVEPSPRMRGRALLSETRRGRHLLATLDPDPVFEGHVAKRRQRRALTRWPWKVIVADDGSATVYDVERDPAEAAPLSVRDSEVPAGMRRAAAGLAREIATEEPRAGRSEPIDPETRAALRALGYGD